MHTILSTTSGRHHISPICAVLTTTKWPLPRACYIKVSKHYTAQARARVCVCERECVCVCVCDCVCECCERVTALVCLKLRSLTQLFNYLVLLLL